MNDDKLELLKKLAAAYGTGWEYREHDGEAGSVLAEVVLSLFELNEKRYEHIWEKQKREFLQLAPEPEAEASCLNGLAAVLTGDRRDGYILPVGSIFTAVTESSEILYFATQESIQLSAAVLERAYYETGGSVYRAYDREEQENLSFSLFREEGEKVKSLKLHWSYKNLCNGLESVDWEAGFTGTGDLTEVYRFCANPERTRITLTDGDTEYELMAVYDEDGEVEAREGNGIGEDSPGQFRLCADTPDFARKLQETVYDICLEILDPHEGKKLSGLLMGLVLKLTERGKAWKPQLYLTDLLQTVGDVVLPFTEEPDSYACCYIGCDGAFARTDVDITIHFQESYRVEELLPEEKPEEYKKKMKKYAWMLPEDKVLDWCCTETIWEYYNGTGWRPLPGSSDWNTGCTKEDREVRNSFKLPGDIQACVMEGEEHYYLRLRLVHVQDAYTRYYHKYIPVLKDVTFTCPPRHYEAEHRGNPGMDLEELSDRMYFAFSHKLPSRVCIELTHESSERVYKGEWEIGPEKESGWKEMFGYYGYWVTVMQDMFSGMKSGSVEAVRWQDGEKKRLILSGLWCNPVKLRQIYMEGDIRERNPGEITEDMILTPVQDPDRILAIALENFYLAGDGSALPDPVKAAGHYFTGQGRVVNKGDLEKLLKERYSWIEEVAITMMQNKQLTITLCGLIQSNKQEAQQQEIQGWLESCLEQNGCWWLRECEIVVKIYSGTGIGDDRV